MTCAFDSLAQLLIVSYITRENTKNIVKSLSKEYEYFHYIELVSEGKLTEHEIYKRRCTLLLQLMGYRRPLHGALSFDDEKEIYTLDCLSNAGTNMVYFLPNYYNYVEELLPCFDGQLPCKAVIKNVPRIFMRPENLISEDFEFLIENHVRIQGYTYCDTKIGSGNRTCNETGTITIGDTCAGLRGHRLISTGDFLRLEQFFISNIS